MVVVGKSTKSSVTTLVCCCLYYYCIHARVCVSVSEGCFGGGMCVVQVHVSEVVCIGKHMIDYYACMI